MRRPFTKNEIDYLMQHYPDDTGPEIASAIGRAVRSVYHKAHSLKLEKSEEFKRSHKSRLFTGIEGINYRFQKGNVPWSKGTKGIITGGIATQFKKGNLPKNTKYDGCITTRKSNHGKLYKWIRVSKGKWIMLHVKIWVDSHGDVPNGKIVVFKNGDTMDIRAENLELISLAENMRRNTIQKYPEDLKKSIRALGKLKRLINEKNESE